MSTINLSLGDIYALEVEISGAKNPQTGEQQFKGLLSHKLSLVTKFKLKEIRDAIAPHKKNVDELREELIKKLGSEDKKSGNISLQTFIDKVDAKGKVILGEDKAPIKVINPNFVEFNQELEKLLAQTKDISLPALKIEDFDVETEESYEIFYKLFTPVKETTAS